MSDKGGNGGSKTLGTLAAFAAAFGARKVIALAWRQALGKEPPTDPHDPEITLGEALGWAILTGVTIETARLLAIRLTTRRMRQPGGAA